MSSDVEKRNEVYALASWYLLSPLRSRNCLYLKSCSDSVLLTSGKISKDRLEPATVLTSVCVFCHCFKCTIAVSYWLEVEGGGWSRRMDTDSRSVIVPSQLGGSQKSSLSGPGEDKMR